MKHFVSPMMQRLVLSIAAALLMSASQASGVSLFDSSLQNATGIGRKRVFDNHLHNNSERVRLSAVKQTATKNFGLPAIREIHPLLVR